MDTPNWHKQNIHTLHPVTKETLGQTITYKVSYAFFLDRTAWKDTEQQPPTCKQINFLKNSYFFLNCIFFVSKYFNTLFSCTLYNLISAWHESSTLYDFRWWHQVKVVCITNILRIINPSLCLENGNTMNPENVDNTANMYMVPSSKNRILITICNFRKINFLFYRVTAKHIQNYKCKYEAM
jgi:hypothetical protein